jgi:hypothetical protein
MVKGLCRGKMCDFWAQVRIRKADPDRLLEEMCDNILVCRDNGKDIEDAIQGFWKLVGLRNLGLLCIEEPDLCTKIRMLEEQVRDLVS